MPQIGIRKLKNQTSEIIRAVREQHVEYVVTHRGEPVAVILPIGEAVRARGAERLLAETREHADYWARLDALAAEIDAAWTSDKTAVELVDEQRRDL
ncbi:MAG: type II toxin-antitoxin system Phd/YefM family antitoxin [Chloroflexi bacterium]|nr:type II toxin-antitoxin system Phd/YefM family antitoxin [Chloroflexota bacterium]